MLTTMAELLNTAKKGNYAVAAPNVWNEESIRASIAAAEHAQSPVILNFFFQAASPDPRQLMYDQVAYARPWAHRAGVPIAINLDHGKVFDHAVWAIRAGMTSVMIDRSAMSYEENVAEVKQLASLAHAVDVSVEAELGHVGSGSNYEVDGKSCLTEPSQAARYVRDTSCDCLAVAIGTAHGAYSGTPHIDFERLEEIRNAVEVPLVLHGGSGTGDDNLARACRSGISKVNLFTDLVAAGTELLKREGVPSHRINLVEELMYRGFREKLEHYMQLFGSAGKA